MNSMPELHTERLIVRPFRLDDLDDIYRILDVEPGEAEAGAPALAARREWLRWTVLGYDQLARLAQPPYGDRAVVLKASGQLVGAVGYVPCLNAFGQLPYFESRGLPADRCSAECGLFWTIALAHRRRGYATEAARALIDYAFEELRLGRIVATTAYNNEASIGVMRQLGMRVERNPRPGPAWLQIVGILDNG